ncbi:hypothetical protein [Archangium gephyra]|uniref:hypothetical protein n=2 Tax=Archangium gephyra TaxID=48 RepID=UPI00069D845C|nr:hypothetical protein [Archangium gephyra]
MKVNFGRPAAQGALALVLALVLPFAAPAANDGEIRNVLISINRLYEGLDYELALRQVQLGRQLPRSTDHEVTLSLYEGIILYELRKQSPAASVFRSALLLKPDAKLPVQVAPKVEALFESVRKQVKQEVEPLLPPNGTEKPSNKAEQKRETPPAPPSTGSALEKREDTRIAQSSREEEASSVEPMAPAPSTQKAEQQKDGPVAVQPIKPPDCAPEPYLSGRTSKERQLSRLVLMKQALCTNGKFQGLVYGTWMKLKNRIETASTIDERRLITTDLDQFAREFVYEDPEQEKRDRLVAEQREAERLAAEQREAERLAAEQQEAERLAAEQREAERLTPEQQEAKRLAAEQQEAERLAAEQREAERKNARDTAAMFTSKCQPIVSADCELLMQRLLSVQETFLRANPSSRLVPIRQLVTIGQKIRAARTKEQLREAGYALDRWQQQQLSQ